MGDNCCGCDFRDDCDKPEKKDEPTEECVCEECGCDPCECEDADDKKGKDKEEKQFRNITKITDISGNQIDFEAKANSIKFKLPDSQNKLIEFLLH